MRRVVGLVLIALVVLGGVVGCGGSGTKAKHSDADRPK
jgi:hypothetical protein